MITSRLNKLWTLIIIFLVAIIAISSIVAWSRYSPSQPIEISIAPAHELQGEIYVGGAVTNPGFYSLLAVDSIDALVQAAGGTTSNADLSRLELYVPNVEEEEQPQKINLNRAEMWLLEALPGIGETLAQRIIDYRQQKPFRNINELIKVEGMGITTYDKIKDLITVAD